MNNDSDVEDVYPLTPMQNGILFHTLRVGHAGPYIEQFVFTLSGPLDLPRFEQAWSHVVNRHTGLRTAVVWEGVDEPVQVVVRECRMPVVEHEIAADLDAALASFLAADRAEGFRLTQVPLMRLNLLRQEERAVLVWTVHHLIMDGWSLPIIVTEVAAAYRALIAGDQPGLPAARPFRDFFSWLTRQDIVAAKQFWTGRLDGVVATDLRSLAAASAEHWRGSATAGRSYHDLSPALSAAVTGAARASRVTLNTLFQLAWALVLARHTGGAEVTFGATVSGRPSELSGIEGIVGVMINTIPLRVTFDPRQSVDEALRKLQQSQLDAAPFQHIGLAALHELTGIKTLFDSIFVFENYPSENPSFDLGQGNHITIDEVIEDAGYPFTLTVLPRHPSIRLQLLYDSSLFSDDVAMTMQGSLEEVLSQLAGDPSQSMSALLPQTLAPAGLRPMAPAPEVDTRPGGDPMNRPALRYIGGLWDKILRRPVVHADADFFRLGGDSLAAVRLTGQMRAVFGSAIAVSDVFQHRTLQELASCLDERLGGPDVTDSLAAARLTETPKAKEPSRVH